MHKSFVRESYPEYDRKSRNAKAATFLEDLQPFPAIIGLVGTLLTIVFTTATWWDTKADIRVVAQSVGAVRLDLRYLPRGTLLIRSADCIASALHTIEDTHKESLGQAVQRSCSIRKSHP